MVVHTSQTNPFLTKFPDMWIYFRTDYRDTYFPMTSICDYYVWAVIQSSKVQQNLGIWGYEVWFNGGCHPHDPAFYYLANGRSLLLLEEISTPKREEKFVKGAEYDDEGYLNSLDTEKERVAAYVKDFVAKLENDEIDSDSLPWIYSEERSGSKKDYNDYWTRMKIAKKLETAAIIIAKNSRDIIEHLKNIKEFEQALDLSGTVLELAEALRAKSFDPDFDSRMKESLLASMEKSKAAYEANPQDKRLKYDYLSAKEAYDVACGRQPDP